VVGASGVAAALYLVAALGFRVADNRPGRVMLTGTPSLQFLDQTATASPVGFPMGRPTESLHDPW
jgi:hypothetical protein